MVRSNLLKKYDEELEGPKKSSFRIGSKGEAKLDDEDLAALGEKERRLAKLKKLQSLNKLSGNQLTSEYMTQEEVSFKKVKKSKKKKKKMLTADDLQPLEDDAVHHGSRNRLGQVGHSHEDAEGGEGRIKSLRELMEEDEQENKNDMDEGNHVMEDDGLNDDDELQEALAISRKAKLAAKKSQVEREDLKNMLENTSSAPEGQGVELSELIPSFGINSSNEANLVVTLNTTDEFCRTLGDIPTYGLSGNRAEDEQAMAQPAPPKATEREAPAGGTGAWEEVGIEDTRVEIGDSQIIPILDEEPDASKGVGNALRLAIKKGYLEKDQTFKKANAALQHLRAVNYSIDDKAGGEDDRRGRGGGDRYGGPISDFKEKEGYKPKISLEYVDDEGRKLCPKEAFRYLSHKFHGKGSGKNKTEKRKKKWEEELLMKQMSSSDTPLQTLERQVRERETIVLLFYFAIALLSYYFFLI